INTLSLHDALPILNQLESIKVGDDELSDLLSPLKQHHILSTNIGKISSTFFKIGEKTHKLISVGLGNIKTLEYSDYLKIFGNVFQALKQSRVDQATLVFDSFKSHQHTN